VKPHDGSGAPPHAFVGDAGETMTSLVFSNLGASGVLSIAASIVGGNILSGALSIPLLPAGSGLVQPVGSSLSHCQWDLPMASGAAVALIALSPGDPANAPLPWIPPGAHFRATLALALFSGSGAVAPALQAAVQVSLNGVVRAPDDGSPMAFPTLAASGVVADTEILHFVFVR
jgi:hypothetical protein